MKRPVFEGYGKCSFYLYRFRKHVSCGFPIIIFFVIPEYIMKRPVFEGYGNSKLMGR